MVSDMIFEDKPIDLLLSALEKGDNLSASQLLAALDGESESVLEDVFARLAELEILPDIQDISLDSANSEFSLRLKQEQKWVQAGKLLGQLADSDPLKLYFEEISAFSTQEDTDSLAEKLKNANKQGENGDVLATKLLNCSLQQVAEIACAYTGKGVLLLDLIQEGSMGLWEKLTQFQSGDFSEYRDFWIGWYMTKAVVTQAYATGVGQKLRRMMEDYKAVDERLLTELGRNPTMEELAEALHITIGETEMVAQMLDSMRLLQRAKAPRQETLPQEDDQAVEDTAYFQMRQRILELLSTLSEEDAKLLTLRYGLEGGLPQKAADVAKLLNITEQEAVAREAAALSKLREIQ